MKPFYLLGIWCCMVLSAAKAQDVTPDQPQAPAAQSPYAQLTLSPSVEYRYFRTYKISMTTRVIVPDAVKNVTELKIFHALPTTQLWSDTKSGLVTSVVKCSPDTAQPYNKHDSQSMLWHITEGLTPGKTLNFTTELTVRSAARALNLTGHQVIWPANFVAPQDIQADLATVADGIKATHDPTSAVMEFCRWIKANIHYDASVPYLPADINSTMQYRRGHCGHQYRVLRELCKRVGIPIRSVVGLNLDVPDGVHSSLFAIRPDYPNVHTWAEVYFDGVGWAEVEPSQPKNPYIIPAHYIQNNTWFQNYVVWAKENGTWRQVRWNMVNGHYVSAYGIANKITYAELPTPQT